MFSPKTLDRLSAEHIIWMTTVTPGGQPQASPVWYLWDGSVFWVYSLDPTRRLDNIAANPRVSLSLNSDDAGSNIVVVEGNAEVVTDAPQSYEVPGYLARYENRMSPWGGPQGFAAKYSAAIKITPTRVRE
ncbi:MAG: TIGR03667 family PPOX class F420-dependent oxidoreductase [Acidimicrobiia bacterium]|nr:TIGR03667 family PPOX class F420-dependent oxidoreductase [Acidimicrobiia bacterium]